MQLGRGSIRVTEKHYAPWVKARQDRLDVSVIHSWDKDPPIVQQRQGPTKGTPQVHGREMVQQALETTRPWYGRRGGTRTPDPRIRKLVYQSYLVDYAARLATQKHARNAQLVPILYSFWLQLAHEDMFRPLEPCPQIQSLVSLLGVLISIGRAPGWQRGGQGFEAPSGPPPPVGCHRSSRRPVNRRAKRDPKRQASVLGQFDRPCSRCRCSLLTFRVAVQKELNHFRRCSESGL